MIRAPLIISLPLFTPHPNFMRAGAFGFDVRIGISDEFGEFSGGFAATEAVEVGVFLEGDETVLVDMGQGSLLR